ncbi:N,N'-diacetyllegionaminic acid synthase [Pseudoalteromonas sp. THAF3]|uniref:N-acetylneuraminate synthase n=1 Tax=Pseudoalteromonas sp. THAF3 TaxID=2587843 RepID=UPI001268A5D8|nr:N-acetylneuraminate synthase [Pseudoalteromonas sp. THAF3]QFU05538.1 N,N'-diacetyllegionaminic acid synthase [Pseudoalteromonas sp. THAF3]
MNSRTLIIAEAGVNHNGDEHLALELVRQAHVAGADIVKFQTFKAAEIVTQDAAQARYQSENIGKQESQFAMLQRLELSYECHRRLLQECQQLGVEFLSTAFDEQSLSFLINDLGLQRLKIPSGELTNAPLLLKHAQTGCDLLVSTGMATLGEVEQALSVIAYGLTHPDSESPQEGDFAKAYASERGQQCLRDKVTLLHCTTEYPAPLDEINLGAMDSMKQAFHLPVGYSDHSAGWLVPVAAVAKGATVIEKHFTLDCNLPGPDHKASLEPKELQQMIRYIRQSEQALGHGVKMPTASEINNKAAARKSLVAAEEIPAGAPFTQCNLAVKRPGTGMSPHLYWRLLNCNASQNYKPGDLINE